MTVDLSKEDLIRLCKGTCPNYYLQKTPEFTNLGDFSDIHGWRWDENQLNKFDEQTLYRMYRECVKSWEK